VTARSTPRRLLTSPDREYRAGWMHIRSWTESKRKRHKGSDNLFFLFIATSSAVFESSGLPRQPRLNDRIERDGLIVEAGTR
jgi:hypothetical protein